MNQQPDPCSDSLKVLIEKSVYEIYQQKQPTFVRAIADLVAKGQLPTQIEQSINRMIPGCQAVNHTYLIASYLLRLQCPIN